MASAIEYQHAVYQAIPKCLAGVLLYAFVVYEKFLRKTDACKHMCAFQIFFPSGRGGLRARVIRAFVRNAFLERVHSELVSAGADCAVRPLRCEHHSSKRDFGF